MVSRNVPSATSTGTGLASMLSRSRSAARTAASRNCANSSGCVAYPVPTAAATATVASAMSFFMVFFPVVVLQPCDPKQVRNWDGHRERRVR